LIRKKAALVHAVGMNLNGRGLIFSARSGGGKTTIALNSVMGRDILLLGDNYVIFHEGKVYSFVGNMSLYRYNLSTEAKKRISLHDSLRLLLGDIVSKLTNRRVKLATLIDFAELYPGKVGTYAPMSKGFVVLPKVGARDVSIREIDIRTFVGYLVENQKCELLPVAQLVLEYSHFYPDNSMEKQWKAYRAILEENLRNARLYAIAVPCILAKENLNDIMHQLEVDW